MSDGDHLARLQADIEGRDEQRVILSCDAVGEPVDETRRASLIEALLRAAEVGPAGARSAAYRAVARVFRPGMPGVRRLAEAAPHTSLAGGAALDALGEALRLDPAQRAAAREALAAQPDERAAGVAVACVVLGRALLEPSGPLLPGEVALLDLLRRALLASPSVRLCEALSSMGTRASTAAPALRPLCESNDLALASAALSALLSVTPDAPETTAAILGQIDRAQTRAVQWALEACSDALASGPVPAAIVALPPSTLLPFLEPLWPGAVRAAACDILAATGGAAELERLTPLLSERDWPLRVAATEAVATLMSRGVDASDLLARLASQPTREHKHLALSFAFLAGPTAEVRAALLRAVLGDRDSASRDNALALLRSCATGDEISVFVARLAPPAHPSERRRAARALALLPPSADALPALTQGLVDPDAKVRKNCCLAIGSIGAALGPSSVVSAIPALLRRLADGDASHEAREAFRKIGPVRGPFSLDVSGPVDWFSLFHGAFREPAVALAWRPVLAERLRWSARLLHRDPPPVPDDTVALADLLASCGRQRVLKRNRSKNAPLADGAAQEIAWVLARLWQSAQPPSGSSVTS